MKKITNLIDVMNLVESIEVISGVHCRKEQSELITDARNVIENHLANMGKHICKTPDCGVEFPLGTSPQKMYCQECSRKRKRASAETSYARPRPPKTCAWCGNEFSNYKKHTTKYCSKDCANKRYNHDFKEKRAEQREARREQERVRKELEQEIEEEGGFVDAVIKENFVGQPLRNLRPATEIPTASSCDFSKFGDSKATVGAGSTRKDREARYEHKLEMSRARHRAMKIRQEAAGYEGT